MTTTRTPGLTLPDPGASRETYTRTERVSVATLSLVAALALARRRRPLAAQGGAARRACFLLASTQGRALLNRLVRLGRAYNATFLITQRLEDLGELSDLIGTYFIFGQESDREARRALELLGLDPSDATLVARVKEFRRGRCLMRDLDGRVGELHVDPAVPGLPPAGSSRATCASSVLSMGAVGALRGTALGVRPDKLAACFPPGCSRRSQSSFRRSGEMPFPLARAPRTSASAQAWHYSRGSKDRGRRRSAVVARQRETGYAVCGHKRGALDPPPR